MRRSPIIFTPEMDALLISLYPDTPNQVIMEQTGWTTSNIKYACKRLGLKKTRDCKAKMANVTDWTEERITFLKANFFQKTNQELAEALGLRLTVVRNKARELGLKKFDPDMPWNDEQTAYLVANYRTMGDVELAENLQKNWPRKRLWTKKHINKKRYLLGLHRTKAEIEKIIWAHVQPGGRSYTIIRNSSSKNLHDSYVASLIAWRDKDLQREIMKYPELIELKRQEILLSRSIKEVKNA